MKKENIRSVTGKNFRATTDSEHKYITVENKLERNFRSGITGRAWVSDITYIKTVQGWLYLTTVIDLGDCKEIG